MSARNDAVKQSKQQFKEQMKCLIQNVGEHWPDITISEEILRNPTTNFVKGFYANFYSEFQEVTTRIKNDIFNQDVCIDQNIYKDELRFAIEMKKICGLLGIPFNLNDIFEPQPKRTILFCSLLMNIVLCFKRKTEYINSIAECVQKSNHLTELKSSKNVLLEEINDLNALEIQLEDDINDLKKGIGNLTEEHKDIMMQKTIKDIKYQQDYKVIDKLKEDNTASKENLNIFSTKISSLQKQIVNENEIDELKNEINNVEKELEDLDTNRAGITLSLEDQRESYKNYQKCLVSIKNLDFNLDIEKCKTAIEKLTATSQQVNTLVNEQFTYKTSELKCLLEEHDNLVENLQQLNGKFVNITTEMEKIHFDLKKLDLKILEDKDILKNYETENKNSKEKILVVKDDISNMKSCLATKCDEYNKLLEQVNESFHEKLLNTHKSLANIQN
ncbi:uncharacterized protein YGR130C-like [Harmonia axyridis]|uniref:uncharacterized protein YGR130C-like n=1 Tax=Harmonia axyridis TaxID=115357 RepID=UPI001E279BB2|nr:uncharacterized protein YGR130C-like [Harmonia axyridis]